MTNHELGKFLLTQDEMPVKISVWIDRFTGSLDDTDLSYSEEFDLEQNDMKIIKRRKIIIIDTTKHAGHPSW